MIKQKFSSKQQLFLVGVWYKIENNFKIFVQNENTAKKICMYCLAICGHNLQNG